MRRRGSPGVLGAALVLSSLLFAAACSARRGVSVDRAPQPGDEGVAVYRARYDDGRKTRGFRLWLWLGAEARVHAEVLSPIGQTLLVLDGGDVAFAAWDPRERVAWEGPEPERVFDAWVGVPWPPSRWVGVLRGTSEAPDGWSVRRTGERGAYPRTIEIQRGERSLSLTLRRWRPGDPGPEVGRGVAPEGFRLEPFDRWLEPPEVTDPG